MQCSCASLNVGAGGKVLRHTELNTDIITWTRLLTRAAPTVGPHIDATASPMAITQEQAAERNKNKQPPSYESPPSSPLTSTSQSGGSTPKSPITPVTVGRMSPPYFNQTSGHTKDGRKDSLKDSSLPMNGELPPPIPLSEEDLISGIHPSGQNEPIITPPREFLGGSVSDVEQRRSSAGSLQSPHNSTAIGPPPSYVFPETSWNRTRSPPNSPPGTSQVPSQRMTSSGQAHMDPMVGREVRYSDLFPSEFESLGWDEKKQQKVGPRAGGQGVGGSGVDTVDGSVISLYHNHQQQTLQYHRLEHKVCVFVCALYVLWSSLLCCVCGV